MGQSKSIEQKIKDDQKFREFMAILDTESKKEETRILEELKTTAKNQYEGNGWDFARFFGNKQSDYQNYDDWSLSRVVKIVDSIGNALAGGDFPSTKVPGSKDADKSTIDEVKEFMGAFGGDYSLIIARVQALISGVLSQFAVATDVTRKTLVQDTPLSGGLHLFFGSSGKVYTNNTFFTNQFIGSFQIVFEVYMSVDEAKAIGLQQMLVVTGKELEMLNSLILDIRTAQVESLKTILKENPQDFVSTKAAYDVALASVKLDRANLVEEYDKYNQVIETIDNYHSQLDLSSCGIKPGKGNQVSLSSIFNEWEISIAERYIKEKLATQGVLN
nr:hypothetical protein [uncultured Psychroserpens sp.]